MSRLLDLEPILTIRTLQLRKIGWSRLFVFRSASDSNFWPHVLTTQVDFAAHRGRSFTSSTVPLAGLPHQCCSSVFSLGFCPRQPDDFDWGHIHRGSEKTLGSRADAFRCTIEPTAKLFSTQNGTGSVFFDFRHNGIRWLPCCCLDQHNRVLGCAQLTTLQTNQSKGYPCAVVPFALTQL